MHLNDQQCILITTNPQITKRGKNGVIRTFAKTGSRHYGVTSGSIVPIVFPNAVLPIWSTSYKFHRNRLRNTENAHIKILNRKWFKHGKRYVIFDHTTKSLRIPLSNGVYSIEIGRQIVILSLVEKKNRVYAQLPVYVTYDIVLPQNVFAGHKMLAHQISSR